MKQQLPDELRPVLRIGAVAELLDVHPRPLRLCEQHGLVTPILSRGQRKCTASDLERDQVARAR